MAVFDNQPVLVESFAAGTNGAAVPATSGAYFGISSLGTADGTLFDVVTVSSGQAMTYDSTVVSGLTMCKIVTTATTTCFGEWANSGLLGNAAAQQWFRLWLYHTTNPSAAHQVAAMLISGTRAADVVVNANGTVSMRDATGTVQVTTAATVPLGALYRVEGYIVSSATAGQVHLELYTSPYSATPADTQTSGTSLNTTGGAMNQVRYGAATGTTAGLTWWQYGCAVSVTGPVGPGAIVQHMVCGAPTPTGFTVISKPVGATSVRLKVATNSAMTANVTYVSAQAPDAYGYVRHTATGLSPYIRYWVQLADTPPGGTEMLIGAAGTVKTLAQPGAVQSFTFGIASCITTPAGFSQPDAAIADWVAWQPDLSIFLGDYTYEDPVFTDMADQLGCLELYTWFYGNEPLVRQAWGFYCRSNHDTSTATNGTTYDDTDNLWGAANILATQEFFPNGVLGDTVNSPVHSLCESWVQGRVRFIKLDVRNIDRTSGTAADNSSKTMLGAAQLAWLYGQLTAPEPLKIIVTDTQWMGTSVPSTVTDPELGKWWSYQTERAAIVAQMTAIWGQMKNVLLIHGDFHGVAVANASQNAAAGGFPVYCAAPVRQTGLATHNPGTFTAYYNNNGGNLAQYGRVTVTDNGSSITVNFQGWDAIGQTAQVSETDPFSVAAGTLPSRSLMTGL